MFFCHCSNQMSGRVSARSCRVFRIKQRENGLLNRYHVPHPTHCSYQWFTNKGAKSEDYKRARTAAGITAFVLEQSRPAVVPLASVAGAQVQYCLHPECTLIRWIQRGYQWPPDTMSANMHSRDHLNFRLKNTHE
jgi:hypothetical protein